MTYSISHIARIIEATGSLVSDPLIEHLLLDSRKINSPSSSLFFALPGPRRDGHQFIPDLYKRGIRNFVVSEPIEQKAYPEGNFLQVKNTLDALQQLAAWHRKQFSLPVIGITGSNGKTIVKEWLYQLLQEKETIVRSPKSFNSQIGVPLSVWQINESHSLGIFEAGISQPGEMERLERIIAPGIGILTSLGNAHSEGFVNSTEKLQEKLKLFRNAAKVYCHSKYDPDSEVNRILSEEHVRVIYCGSGKDEDIFVSSVVKEGSFTTITVKNPAWSNVYGEHTFSFKIPFTDDASIENAILCFAVCLDINSVCQMGIDAIKKKFERLEPIEMRMQLKKGINNCYIINDSYSNDLSSFGIALDYLKQQSGKSTTTVILSDILQSGMKADELYTRVAAELKARNVQRLIGIGEQLSSHAYLFKDAVADSSFYPATDIFLEQATSHQFRENYILLKGARTFAFERINNWLEQKVHQTLLEINLNAIVHNLKTYQQLLRPSTKVMAMVKAFAYGSGGAEIASILQYHKVDYLGVAYVDEGVELRRAGISLPVMVMNPEESSFDALVNNNLEPELYSFALLKSFDAFIKKEGLKEYPVHIEVETGMNRLGFDVQDMDKLGEFLKNGSSLKVQTVFSHLAASEEAVQDSFTLQQFEKFETAAALLEQKLGYSFLRHIANSAAILRHPPLQLDMVRLGIGMYGIDSSGLNKNDLHTVATLRSTVAQLKHLKAGESVSYNRKGKVNRDSVIATVRLGYADGYPRRLGNGAGKMYIHGQLAPVIGTVCMDMTMIDVTGIAGVAEGDDVIVFGKELGVQQLAEWAGTIPYEIMTGISQRVKRVYFEE